MHGLITAQNICCVIPLSCTSGKHWNGEAAEFLEGSHAASVCVCALTAGCNASLSNVLFKVMLQMAEKADVVVFLEVLTHPTEML